MSQYLQICTLRALIIPYEEGLLSLMLVGVRARTLGGSFTLLQNLLYSGAVASKSFPHHAAYVQCREAHYTSYIHDDTRCSK